MNDSMNDKIQGVSNRLKRAKQNLDDLREQYKMNPDLLSIYEPSAVYIVNQIESKLKRMLSEQFGVSLQPEQVEQENVDIWVRIEGKEFKNGSGPIGQIGTYLTLLNKVNKQAMALVKEKMGEKIKLSDLPSLNLVATAPGSLKLGLNKPQVETPEPDPQADLFNGYKGNWELLKESLEESSLVSQGMQLIVRSIASISDESVSSELKQEYTEKSIIKMLHYVKDLTPSSRSDIDYVSFEGNNIRVNNNYIKTTKETRKLISEYSKKLAPNTEYVEGTATIMAADISNQALIARPFKFNGAEHKEIKCILLDTVPAEDIKNLLNQKVELSGYIVFDKNRSKMLRLEIDHITISDNNAF
ncbi:hypothetical protein BK124_09865 [Paenibacillus amylolyticus]|uniref:hypothetical protein n=1 Tax=Paenibacillus amylolyticus TaxID=1451 RepID=UPI00096E7DF1|nr:hypothetical protein [Paenibacillus amylolyticus]OME99852.1 hypothetical protein BK124_09865 [Paenibacillus amylolyticus]